MNKSSYLSLLPAMVFVAMAFFACGGSGSDAQNSPDTESAAPAAPEAEAEVDEEALQASIERGEVVYTGVGICITCHQANGQGQEGLFPPLAKSDYLMADRVRSIRQILYGANGEMVVNGVTYNGAMPAMGLTLNDQQVADVLNYVMNSWGNENKDMITPAEVAEQREDS